MSLKAGGWIGVDLDGTLALYEHKDVWDGSIGAPIPRMVARVKQWLALGVDVRIMTARVADYGGVTDGPRACDEQRRLIQAWCITHIGRTLAVTCSKDYGMYELWDDRAIQVVKNTGERADEEVAARLLMQTLLNGQAE